MKDWGAHKAIPTKERLKQIHAHNWKVAQIEKLKAQRVIAALGKPRSKDIGDAVERGQA